MLPSAAVIEAVAAIVTRNELSPLVVDPVIRSTSGFDLIDASALAALVGRLFPLAALVTPNPAEAERLVGYPVTGLDTQRRAAETIGALGARAVLVKGGDLPGDRVNDVLFAGGEVHLFSSDRLGSSHTHGTGCTLSAAIACLMARGRSLPE